MPTDIDDPELRYQQKHVDLLIEEGEQWKVRHNEVLRCHYLEDRVADLNRVADWFFRIGGEPRKPSESLAADAFREEARLALYSGWRTAAQAFIELAVGMEKSGYEVDGADVLRDNITRSSGILNPLDIACRRVDRLSRLQDNWNGYGAKPLDPGLIAQVRAFVSDLPSHLYKPVNDDPMPAAPFAVAVAAGSIQLEWHVGDRLLELEFEKSGAISYLRWWPQVGVEDENSYPASDAAKSVALIEWALHGRDNG